MVKDIKYIIKRIVIGVGIALILMLFKGGFIADVHAASNYTIILENSSTPSYNTSGDTNGTLYVTGAFTRVSIIAHNFSLTDDGKYELYSSIILGINRGSTCTSSNFGLRSDFYIGNYNRTSWITPTTTWNNVDDITLGNNNFCNYNWGSVQKFTSNINSNGVTYDFYFTNPTQINYIRIDRFDLINTGTTTGDAINNQTNTIINNQNNNTNSIINNQNNNTQDIINNQNQNTEKEIESQKVCGFIDNSNIVDDNKYLNSSGVLQNSFEFGVTDYISIDSSSELKVVSPYISSLSSGTYYCFYNSNKALISCSATSSLSTENMSVTIPQNTSYIRASINKNPNKPTFKYCKSGNQALNDSINDLNDSINDDSVDDPNSDINTMKGKLANNGIITQLLTLPITLYQSVLNNINGSCSTFNLGSLYNHNLSLPCIQPENYLGSNLWGVIDVLCCGLFILSFRKKMVDIFNHMSSLKDGGNELE